MKSKLAIIPGVIIIASTALPTHAVSDSEITNRAMAIGWFATMNCFVNIGKASEETIDEVTLRYLNKNTNLKPAFTWATSSVNGKAGVQALTPYLSSDCRTVKKDSGKTMKEIVGPFIN